ncbi:MAG TPA: tRNA (guanosine(37)-N1)-methyltransferase TrmD, partial [Bacillota bacterium]|nr:tRNA (guanosine(37)-N1)-methyltransferase TrmD [Bacillota bacterium]
MKAYILTLFPEMFAGVLNSSIMKRAQEQGLLEVHLVNIREFAEDRHGTVDDYPYGGGPGMVMKPEPVYEAIEWIREQMDAEPYVVLLSPQGRRFDSTCAREIAEKEA